jgi:hypothetical protein
MSPLSKITLGDWIKVGKQGEIEAVVCNIRPAHIEVVYLDEAFRALHKEVIWARTHWDFEDKKSPAKHADKDSRLEPYLKILRTKKE